MIWLLERMGWAVGGYLLGKLFVKKARPASTPVNAGDEDWTRAWPPDPKARAVYLQERAAVAAARAREAAEAGR
jgi:hypothetical protein